MTLVAGRFRLGARITATPDAAVHFAVDEPDGEPVALTLVFGVADGVPDGRSSLFGLARGHFDAVVALVPPRAAEGFRVAPSSPIWHHVRLERWRRIGSANLWFCGEGVADGVAYAAWQVHPGFRRLYHVHRREKEFPVAVRRATLVAAGGRCQRCGAPAAVLDHIRRIADGGGNTIDNARALCGACHEQKSAVERTYEVRYSGEEGAGFRVAYRRWVERKTRRGELCRLRVDAQAGPFASRAEAGAFVAARVAEELGW